MINFKSSVHTPADITARFNTHSGQVVEICQSASPRSATIKHRITFDGCICAFADISDIVLCELPQNIWLEFGDLFVWGLSDDAADIVRDYLDRVAELSPA
ncbi:hypothetical protein [Oceanobacter sp. 4_MG-2023]|uniref:hypothetical protein n=1 Tax=Oceanobacter sp. 4_MG-2023 TaxID=3062623 RepID=UPI00273287A7|nr:hypothetical protein [Oceanobacter sp. 4_MG-2023]MDP2548877.1 hypothetical protein [Oceanobacter sp. 4_MG-2023]